MKKTKAETRAIDKTDIDEILEIAKTESDENIRSLLQQYLEKIVIETEKGMRATLVETNGRLIKTGIDNVALRTQTVHLLLNEFRAVIEEKSKFERALYIAGLNVGRSFFDDFWNFQLKKNIIPRTYDVLLSLWARYDSSAGFGQFELSDQPVTAPTIKLLINNSFLTRGLLGLESNAHPFCNFMRGYVRGVIGSCLFVLPRWLKDNGYLPPVETLKVISTEHKPFENSCRIVVQTGKETLTDAYDKLYSARLNLLNDNLLECIFLARGALESAAKNKLGLPLRDPTSFHKLVRELSKVCYEKFPNPISTYRELYGVASEVIHGGKLTVDLNLAKKLVDGTTEFVDVLENEIDLKERDKEIILKNIMESSEEGASKPSE